MLSNCFASGHHSYGRYPSWYVRQMEYLPRHANYNLLTCAQVCRQSDGGREVPADQFGEHAYVEPLKDARKMKDISTSAEQVAVGWRPPTTSKRCSVVSRSWNIDVAGLLQFDLSPVHPVLINECGCLRKDGMSVLVICLGVCTTTPPAPDVVLVDAGQLLYHVVWPVAGTAGDLASSFGARLANYPPGSNTIVTGTIKSILAQRTREGQ